MKLPISQIREAELTKQIERDFAQIEQTSSSTMPGLYDLLEIYGGLELAMRQTDIYLTLLNPITPASSTTNSANVPR